MNKITATIVGLVGATAVGYIAVTEKVKKAIRDKEILEKLDRRLQEQEETNSPILGSTIKFMYMGTKHIIVENEHGEMLDIPREVMPDAYYMKSDKKGINGETIYRCWGYCR